MSLLTEASSLGNTFGQGKNVPLIALAQEIPYVATATVADLRDLEYKATRAMDFHGARYLHILVPCPLGWGSSPADTIRVARLAAESGLFPVFEAESGQVMAASPIRRQVPVQDYLRLQTRYRHLFHRPQARCRRGRRGVPADQGPDAHDIEVEEALEGKRASRCAGCPQSRTRTRAS
jgi:pyruvate/2-oxoacid:ferredoxin oxidoreductase beta subunit